MSELSRCFWPRPEGVTSDWSSSSSASFTSRATHQRTFPRYIHLEYNGFRRAVSKHVHVTMDSAARTYFSGNLCRNCWKENNAGLVASSAAVGVRHGREEGRSFQPPPLAPQQLCRRLCPLNGSFCSCTFTAAFTLDAASAVFLNGFGLSCWSSWLTVGVMLSVCASICDKSINRYSYWSGRAWNGRPLFLSSIRSDATRFLL